MPSANGKGKRRDNGPSTLVAAGPVILTSDEITGLRNRFETWQAQAARSRNEQLLEMMAQESYQACTRSLQAKYGLPSRFIVDFDTGAVVIDDTQDAKGAADG